MASDARRLNELLRPISEPRVLDGVYTDDQHERMLDVIKRDGPWRTIMAQHFDSVEELMATSNGGGVDKSGLTLDDVATANFRGTFGKGSTCLYPQLEDCYYSSKFLAARPRLLGRAVRAAHLMLFNLCGPHHSSLNAHLDAVTFRGIRIENSPVWLQNVMGKSGLFTEYLVKMAQVITWWYLGENGTFTYWPDGPLGEPAARAPTVEQGRRRAERDDVPPRRPHRPPGRTRHRGSQAPIAARVRRRRDDWVITTDGEVIRRYRAGADAPPRALERRGVLRR